MTAKCEAFAHGVDDGPPKVKRRPGKDGASELVVKHASNTAVADARQQHLEAVTVAFSVIANAECSRVEAYITAGEALVQARAAGAYGTWRAWLEAHFSRSEDTAERAMTCWLHRDELRQESARVRGEFSLRKALDFIAQQKKPSDRQSQRKKETSKKELKERIEKLEQAILLKEAAIEAALQQRISVEHQVEPPVDTTMPTPAAPVENMSAETDPVRWAAELVGVPEAAERKTQSVVLAADQDLADQVMAGKLDLEEAYQQIAPVEPPLETEAAAVHATSPAKRDGYGLLECEMDARYGPLTGHEWWGISEGFQLRPGRGRRRQPVQYDDLFLKLIDYHSVPVLRWDEEARQHAEGGAE